MTQTPPLSIVVNNAVRDLSAALGATSLPAVEQQREVHGLTPQAQAVLRYMETFRRHPAIQYLQGQISAGHPLSSLYSAALFNLSADPNAAALVGHLTNIHTAASLNDLWRMQADAWQDAQTAVRQHLKGVDLAGNMARFFGVNLKHYQVLPNLLFPSNQVVYFRAGPQAACILPPRKAVGESPPWPFSDDREYVLKVTAFHYALLAFDAFLDQHPKLTPELQNRRAAEHLPDAFRARYPTWREQLAVLLGMAITAQFLNEVESGAGDAYLLFERRAHQLPYLNQMAQLIDAFLTLQQRGVHHDLSTYLPYLVQQLTV